MDKLRTKNYIPFLPWHGRHQAFVLLETTSRKTEFGPFWWLAWRKMTVLSKYCAMFFREKATVRARARGMRLRPGQLSRSKVNLLIGWLKRFSLFRSTVRSWEFGLMLIGAQNYLQVESCLKMNFIIIRESHKFKWYWEIHIKKKISCSEAEQYALKLFRKYGYSSSMKSKFYQNNWKFQDEHSWEWDEYVIRERP